VLSRLGSRAALYRTPLRGTCGVKLGRAGAFASTGDLARRHPARRLQARGTGRDIQIHQIRAGFRANRHRPIWPP